MRVGSPVVVVGFTVLVLLTGSASAASGPLPPLAQTVSTPTLTADPTPASTPPPAAEPTLPPLPLHAGNPVTVSASWWAWSLLDRRTGQVWGSANDTETNWSASMIKAWLGALYLRNHPNPSRSWLATISAMIRDSDNDAANDVNGADGGNAAMTRAMQTVCGVSGVKVTTAVGWGSTRVSPLQEIGIGDCIASGRVANPQWTDWLLNEMRQVRGEGDFGIRLAFPQPQRSGIAIKNGWLPVDELWMVNCLAISDTWILVVESRSSSFAAGSGICDSVTEQLLAPPVAADRPPTTP